jgi:hypothetical protein
MAQPMHRRGTSHPTSLNLRGGSIELCHFATTPKVGGVGRIARYIRVKTAVFAMSGDESGLPPTPERLRQRSESTLRATNGLMQQEPLIGECAGSRPLGRLNRTAPARKRYAATAGKWVTGSYPPAQGGVC